MAADLWRTIGASVAFAWRGAPGFEAHLTPTGWLILTGEPVADLNMIFVDDGPDPEGQLHAFGEVLRHRALPALVLLSDPIADRLVTPATALGLQLSGHVPLMVHRPVGEDAPSTAVDRFRVEVVTDTTALGEACQLAAEAFALPLAVIARVLSPAILDTPGVTIFLAREGDQPVSTVMAMQVGSMVGLWTMATLTARQRQGAGRAVLTHALTHHRTRGADLFYLLATEAGKPLYEQVGFQTLAEATVWVSTPP